MTLPRHVKIVEVSPRDGLQNEKNSIPTADKIKLINELSNTGLQVIEATSFVSAKWIPQLSDGKEVLQGINKKPGVLYPVLVPNVRGLENAIESGAKAIAVFTTPSEQFSKKNTNCSVAESIERVREVINVAKQHHLWIRGYISCVLGCPFEGEMRPEKVANIALKLVELGCDELSLGDTIGVGTPIKTQQLIKLISRDVPIEKIAVHFHDTYGQALANILAALQLGIAIVDSSVAGVGGCPYASGATGNVATEDVVYMLKGMGIETGVDLNKLIKVGKFVSELLNRPIQSKVNLAAKI